MFSPRIYGHPRIQKDGKYTGIIIIIIIILDIPSLFIFTNFFKPPSGTLIPRVKKIIITQIDNNVCDAWWGLRLASRQQSTALFGRYQLVILFCISRSKLVGLFCGSWPNAGLI